MAVAGGGISANNNPVTPPPLSQTDSWLAEQADLHARFAESRMRVFAGRQAIQQQLSDYLLSDSRRSFLFAGASGSGKSALLAKIWQQWKLKIPGDIVVVHFVGAGPASTDLRLLLRRLCMILRKQYNLAEQITDRYGYSRTVPKAIPDGTDELIPVFQEFLKAIPANLKTLLLVDAITLYGKALMQCAHVLQQSPELAFDQLCNRLKWRLPHNRALPHNLNRAKQARRRPWFNHITRTASQSALLSTITGHEESVNSCGYSPDGRLIFTFRGHTDQVNGCAFHPDGKRIISVACDATLELWSMDIEEE